VLGAVAAATSTVVVALLSALVRPEVRPVAVPVKFVATPLAGVPSAGLVRVLFVSVCVAASPTTVSVPAKNVAAVPPDPGARENESDVGQVIGPVVVAALLLVATKVCEQVPLAVPAIAPSPVRPPHANVRPPVPSCVKRKVTTWPDVIPASVQDVTLPVRVIVNTVLVFETAVKVGVAP
tara:strand:- start:2361 stop:2900 length:540 start_codon:yes stop_codon:yes gene_type:complete